VLSVNSKAAATAVQAAEKRAATFKGAVKDMKNVIDATESNHRSYHATAMAVLHTVNTAVGDYVHNHMVDEPVG
jgi:uncharacterized protein (DUF2236 family)